MIKREPAPEALEKYRILKEDLKALGSVAVAFSGGVDSTFLLKTARDVLGDRAVALTADACFFPRREHEEAEEFCRREGIRQILLEVDETKIEGFSSNPPDRCYLCKKSLFSRFVKEAEELGLACVAEGSNMDDTGDYRPGMRAIRELGVVSPLKKAGLYKAEIRDLSAMLGLPTWDKLSFACLASRFVYGETITRDRLKMVERAEDLLADLGFGQRRVRVHGDLARIEVTPADFDRVLRQEVREEIVRSLKDYGFSYVSLDLTGYRTGSMNEVLPEAGKSGQA